MPISDIDLTGNEQISEDNLILDADFPLEDLVVAHRKRLMLLVATVRPRSSKPLPVISDQLPGGHNEVQVEDFCGDTT